MKNVALQWVNKVILEIGMGIHLACLAMNLATNLVKLPSVVSLLNKNPKFLSLGICIFLLKLFYSVGLDSPSIVNTKQPDILKYV